MPQPNKFIALVILGLFSFQRYAFAYVDPGTGSYIVQGLLGAIGAGALLINTYWSAIVVFGIKMKSKLFGKKASPDEHK